MTKPEFLAAAQGTRVTAHAIHVGDRINTVGFEGEALSAVPLAVRVVDTPRVFRLMTKGMVIDLDGKP